MNAREFFYTVAQMRSAQQAYFKTRDPNVFRAARKLENIIDREIERVRSIVVLENTSSASATPDPSGR